MEKGLDFKPKMISAIKNYDRKTFVADLMAGVIVGIVALPLAIAFGIASGVALRRALSRPSSPVFSSRSLVVPRYR